MIDYPSKNLFAHNFDAFASIKYLYMKKKQEIKINKLIRRNKLANSCLFWYHKYFFYLNKHHQILEMQHNASVYSRILDNFSFSSFRNLVNGTYFIKKNMH